MTNRIAIAFLAVAFAVADAHADDIIVINSPDLFGGAATLRVPSNTTMYRVQLQQLPLLPHQSPYFSPYRYGIGAQYSGYHALYVSPDEATLARLRTAQGEYNQPGMTMHSETLGNLIARARDAGYRNITVVNDGIFRMGEGAPAYIIIGEPPAPRPPANAAVVGLPEASPAPRPVITLSRRPAITWGWGAATRRTFVPRSLTMAQAYNLLTTQLATTATLASAAWTAQIVIANDAQLRRVALLRRNATQLETDYWAWLRSDASGLGTEFWGHPDSQNHPDLDTMMANRGSGYLAYFFSVPEIRAAQIYREDDGHGGQHNAGVFSRLAIEAFHRLYMARFLTETSWNPPFSYVSVTQPGSNTPWLRRPCLTFHYMVFRRAGRPTLYYEQTIRTNSRYEWSETGMTQQQFDAHLAQHGYTNPVDDPTYDAPAPRPDVNLRWRDLPPVPLDIDGNVAAAVATATTNRQNQRRTGGASASARR